jgi:hypothetical protein
MLTNPLHLVGVAVLASAVSAQADSPEAVIRSFVHAMYSNDLGTYEALTLPIPGRERLEKGGAVNVEAKEELEHNPEAVQLRMMRPYQFRGRELDILFAGAPREPEPSDMPFVVQRIGTRWRVQPEPYFLLISP